MDCGSTRERRKVVEEVVAIMCRRCVIISLFLKSAKTLMYIVIRATLNIAVAVVLCVCASQS